MDALNESYLTPSTVIVQHGPPVVTYTSSESYLPKPPVSLPAMLPGTSKNYSIMPSASNDQLQKRRSSSRSIKRKKFDDELVESSLVKSSRPRPPMINFPMLTASGYPIMSPSTHHHHHPSSTVSSSSQLPSETTPPVPVEKRKPRPPPRRAPKKSKNAQLYVTKDIGRWKPADDLALIFAVQQSNDLAAVYRGVKFSCKFTLQEIQERWYALLYDVTISKVAFNAMKQLHPDIIAQVQGKCLFSEQEEKLIGTVPSTAQATVEIFQELINKHPDIFPTTRSAKALLSHWTLMKHYSLLPDQSVQKLHLADFVGNFSDAEDLVEDAQLNEPRDDDEDREMRITNRSLKREIRHIENELPKWQVLVDSITGVTPADFDDQTLAVLKGRFVRYLMRSREITIGRSAKDNVVDIDLALEGPARKVSRKQGVIKMESNGEFSILNEGKRPMYVDGKTVLTGNRFKLVNNSVVEIVGLRFIFLVNQDLINTMCAKSG